MDICALRLWRCVAASSTGAIAGLFMLANCSNATSAFSPNYDPQTPVFSNPTAITNPYLPLASLTQDILEGDLGGVANRVERTRQPGTKAITIAGHTVQAMIVEDKDFVDGVLEETTLDYFAQSDAGDVYYLGEDVDVFDANGQVISHDGAWLFGVNTTKLGVLVPAHPAVGDKFRSENVPGITIENDEVLSLSETVTVPTGTYSNCLKIKELNDGEVEFKFYAPHVGVIQEVPPEGHVDLTAHS